jgi:AraC-like DNA-binding protein
MTETPLSGDDRIPTFERLPTEIYFRHLGLQQPYEWEMHFHPWGQFNYVSHGVMYIEVAGKRFLSPPHYAVWVPPGFEHASHTSAAITYRSVYLSDQRSRRMPAEPCTLSVNAILKAILDEFARLCIRRPNSAQQERMALVAIDQIEAAVPVPGYLPYASTPGLQMVLDHAEASLQGRRTTQQFAETFNLTTRTLERRCKAELGMGFGEWRQRLRFTKAVDALRAGRTIQQIAYDLGYASPSAFISMFHRVCGKTPEQYRRSIQSEL